MKRLIFILLIALAMPVIAQTKGRPSLAEQKICSEHVKKSFEQDADPGHIFFTNHFDPKTETCYVAEWFLQKNAIVTALLQDAFEGRVLAYFNEETGDCYIR